MTFSPRSMLLETAQPIRLLSGSRVVPDTISSLPCPDGFMYILTDLSGTIFASAEGDNILLRNTLGAAYWWYFEADDSGLIGFEWSGFQCAYAGDGFSMDLSGSDGAPMSVQAWGWICVVPDSYA